MTARSPKSGINFVCSSCGTLLHHIGTEGGDGATYSAYPRQPISEILKNCPECGRELVFDVDLSAVRIHGLKEDPSLHESLTKIVFSSPRKQR